MQDLNSKIPLDEDIRRERNCADLDYKFAVRRKIAGGQPVLSIWSEMGENYIPNDQILATEYISDATQWACNLNRLGATAFVTVERCKASTVARCRDSLSELAQTPWHTESWFRYPVASKPAPILPHIPDSDLSVIAYFANDRALILGRVTTIAPGRFLQRYFATFLTAAKIASLTAKFASDTEKNGIQFARTESECAQVYIDGPHSCMDSRHGFDATDWHPARVYGGPDLAVAYMVRNERITARAVVWPDRKYRTTIYGDADRFKPLLEKAGYIYRNEFTGARLRRVEDGDRLRGPYLDWAPMSAMTGNISLSTATARSTGR